MNAHDPDAVQSKAAIAGHPIHPMLIPFPIAALSGALVTDIVFWQSGDPFWTGMSFWLLAGGIATGAAAALFGLIDFFGLKVVRSHKAAWVHFLGNAAALALAIVNLLMRMEDPAEAVVPLGLVLSAVVALMLVITGWLGGELSYRHRIGVMERK